MIKMILDVMGQDAPASEFIRGAVDAVREYGVDMTLVGDEDLINDVFIKEDLSMEKIDVMNAGSFITMEDSAMSVVKEKSDSSMNRGLKLLASGGGDAFLSAGNSGALLAGATFIVRRIRGLRAAFGATLPFDFPTLLVDSGANTVVTPADLVSFAKMGRIYCSSMYHRPDPTVGLLNNGTEETKGTPLQKEAYELLKSADVNFIGNVEGFDLTSGKADVIVCDGFTGNIALKTAEAVGRYASKSLEEALGHSVLSKAAALPLRKKLRETARRFDPSEYGGAPLLGISKPVVKIHGSADARAVKNAIRSAIYYVSTGVIYEIARNSSTLVYKDGAPVGKEKK